MLTPASPLTWDKRDRDVIAPDPTGSGVADGVSYRRTALAVAHDLARC